MKGLQDGLLPFALSLSLVILTGPSYSQVPINSVNDGKIIQGGTYANTPDGLTTFKNTSGGGLWLQKGSNLRGVESNSSGTLTGNGGSFHFYAPGQAVRLDGNIDVRGLQNGSGAYLGNGGKVFVDSAYLYQSGNIYANGINGGLVQFNVGSATLADTARIEAKGSSGQSGIVAINASGSVDLQRQTVIDTSGKVAGTIDRNVINIEGGLLNVEGTLQANGVQSRGGMIRLVSTGQTNLTQSQEAIQHAAQQQVFTSNEADTLNTRLTTLKSNYDGDIRIASAGPSSRQAIITVQGIAGSNGAEGNDSADPDARAGDGGTIIMAAQNRILNGGWILADGAAGLGTTNGSHNNGGNGGTISLNARSEIITSGRITANGGAGGTSTSASTGGKGGDAGLIAFSYKDGLSNTNSIIAAGGRGGQGNDSPAAGGTGGLIVFSSTSNPAGNGQVITYGGAGGSAGSTFGPLGIVVAPNPVSSSNTLIGIWRKPQPMELLLNGNNLLLLKNSLPTSNTGGTQLDQMTYNAQVRSVRDQAGQAPGQHGGLAENEFFSKLVSISQNPQQPGKTYFNNLTFASTRSDNVALDVSRLNRNTGDRKVGDPFYTQTYLSSGGIRQVSAGPTTYFSTVSYGYNQADTGLLSRQSINIAVDKTLDIFGDTRATDANNSLILKAGNLITVASEGRLATFGSHFGGMQQLFAGSTIRNQGRIEADGMLQGGSVLMQAPTQILNAPGSSITATADQYGGSIKLKSHDIQNQGTLNVNGGVENGQIVLDNSL